MQQANFAVPVKFIAWFCTLILISFINHLGILFAVTILALIHLLLQKKYRLAKSCGIFYLVDVLMLYAIREHGLHFVIFSEFFVLMFFRLAPVAFLSWDLILSPPGEVSSFLSKIKAPSPVILGMMVFFRFFPTLKTETNNLRRSMTVRGLTRAKEILKHPIITFEYIIIPILMLTLQMADRLSISALTRGAGNPHVQRGSYYQRPISLKDYVHGCSWIASTCLFFILKGL